MIVLAPRVELSAAADVVWLESAWYVVITTALVACDVVIQALTVATRLQRDVTRTSSIHWHSRCQLLLIQVGRQPGQRPRIHYINGTLVYHFIYFLSPHSAMVRRFLSGDLRSFTVTSFSELGHSVTVNWVATGKMIFLHDHVIAFRPITFQNLHPS